MELTKRTDILTKEITYVLTIPYPEMVRVKLYPCDFLLFDECEKSKTISDKLLALETLTRRIEASLPSPIR